MKDFATMRQCERCGDAIESDEYGTLGDWQFLCERCYRRLTNAKPHKVSGAVFLGIQEGLGDHPSIAIYNLTESIEGNGYKFCAGSTVTRHSVEEAGYRLPPSELFKASAAMRGLVFTKKDVAITK